MCHPTWCGPWFRPETHPHGPKWLNSNQNALWSGVLWHLERSRRNSSCCGCPQELAPSIMAGRPANVCCSCGLGCSSALLVTAHMVICTGCWMAMGMQLPLSWPSLGMRGPQTFVIFFFFMLVHSWVLLSVIAKPPQHMQGGRVRAERSCTSLQGWLMPAVSLSLAFSSLKSHFHLSPHNRPNKLPKFKGLFHGTGVRTWLAHGFPVQLGLLSTERSKSYTKVGCLWHRRGLAPHNSETLFCSAAVWVSHVTKVHGITIVTPP